MENVKDATHDFEKFAADRLSNHLAELNTRYENEKIDRETLEEAYREHKKIFEMELDETIQSLLSAESNNPLKEELFSIKNT